MIEHPRLLGAMIGDLESWRMHLALTRAMDALPPEPGDMEIYRKHTGRTKWPEKSAKEIALILGARGGKSRLCSFIAAHAVVAREYKLAPGETGYCLIVSPTRKQGSIIKSYTSSYFNQIPALKELLLRETAEEIILKNNLAVAILSSDFKTLRGYTGVLGVIDESAFLHSEGARPAEEVARALRSRMISTGGRLIQISTPFSKSGPLWESFRKHWGKDRSATLVWKATSLEANPTLDRELIEQALKDDPAGAAADYLSEFRPDLESYTNREIVDGCVVPGRYELPPLSSLSYSAFVDPSGGSGKDSMTLAIGHLEDKVVVLDAIREVRPPFSPEQVTADFASLLKSYGVSVVTGDRFGGEWPREAFLNHNITYQVADKTKSDYYREFLPMLNGGRVELLDSETLVNQLCGLERRVSRGGRDSIDHGSYSTARDDVANAVAGCCVILGAGGATFSWPEDVDPRSCWAPSVIEKRGGFDW
jgi:hypothetical protein